MKKGEKFGGEFTPEQAEAATENRAEETLTNRISELLRGITTSAEIEPESGLNLKNPGNITRAVDRISEAVEAKTRGKYSIMQRIRNLPAAVKGTRDFSSISFNRRSGGSPIRFPQAGTTGTGIQNNPRKKTYPRTHYDQLPGRSRHS